MANKHHWGIGLMLILSCIVGITGVRAQDVAPEPATSADTPGAPLTATPTELPTATTAPLPPLTVTLVEPSVLLAGRVGTLSIFGQSFSNATIARLRGFGLLRVTVVNAGAITAEVPADVPPGIYTLEIGDSVSPAVPAPVAITLLAPTGTPAPTVPVTETPLPTSTAPPPTPVPGQPALIVRRFAAQPSNIAQGGTMQLQLEIFNAGNRSADGIILALADGAFTAAAGQAALVLPALAPSASTVTTLTLTARRDAPLGSTTIPLSLRYRDSEGTTYSVPASASVLITAAAAQTARPIVDGYRVHDTPAIIGETTNVTINLKNIGGVTAEAVVLRFTGDTLLLPTLAGDTFTFGTIAPDAFSVRTIPVRVSSAAAPGLRVQALTVQYVENGAAREVQTSIGVEIAARTVDRPVILLEQYAVEVDPLTPGTRFTLSVTLHNIGAASANALLATVGAVESTGPVSSAPPASGDDANTGSAAGGTTTSTTPSTIFAPIDSGGTVFVGALPAGERVTFTHRLIVNTGVTGGVQSLPITLTYQLADGSPAQTVLPVSLVVLVPPRLQANLEPPLPPTVFVGEPLAVTLQLLNTGRNPQPIQRVELSADGADVLDGALSFVGVIAANDDVTVSGTLLPLTEGELTFTFRVLYADELNQPQALAYPFTVTVVAAPPPEPELFPIEPVATPIPTDLPADFIGQLLIGFLNLAG